MGGIVAGHTIQWRATVLVTALVASYGMLLPVADPPPATVPSHLRSFCCAGGVSRSGARWRPLPRTPLRSE